MNNKNLIFLILTFNSSCMERNNDFILSNQNDKVQLMSQNIVTNSFMRRVDFLSTDSIVSKITTEAFMAAKKEAIKAFAIEIITEIITEVTEAKEAEKNFSEFCEFWSLPQLGNNHDFEAKTPNNLSSTRPPLLSLNNESSNSGNEMEIPNCFNSQPILLLQITNNQNSNNIINIEIDDVLITRTFSNSSNI